MGTGARPRVTAAAGRLLSAADDRLPCAPVRHLIGSGDVELAYAVQQEVSRVRLSRGAQVVGRKVGLTSRAVQAQLGVDQPDFGVLFDDMAYADRETIPLSAVLQPRVEAEIAFILGADLDDDDMDRHDVARAVSYAVAAIEVCGSRIRDWDISASDTIADNASAGAFVLARERRCLDELEPSSVVMSMSADGQVVSSGQGTDCLGDPLNAVLWLARQARAFGDPLRAGQVVLSGALGPMWPVRSGASVVARVSGLGEVTVHFEDDRAAADEHEWEPSIQVGR